MFDFFRIVRWLVPDRRPRLSMGDLEDMDVSLAYPLTYFDQEKFVVEDGELAATAARFYDGEIKNTVGRTLQGSKFLCRVLMEQCDCGF